MRFIHPQLQTLLHIHRLSYSHMGISSMNIRREQYPEAFSPEKRLRRQSSLETIADVVEEEEQDLLTPPPSPILLGGSMTPPSRRSFSQRPSWLVLETIQEA
jgi:hypothetical protein